VKNIILSLPEKINLLPSCDNSAKFDILTSSPWFMEYCNMAWSPLILSSSAAYSCNLSIATKCVSRK